MMVFELYLRQQTYAKLQENIGSFFWRFQIKGIFKGILAPNLTYFQYISQTRLQGYYSD